MSARTTTPTTVKTPITAPLLEKNEFEDVGLPCDAGGEVDPGTNVVTVCTTPPAPVVVSNWGVDVDAGVEVVDVLVEDV